MNVQPPSLRGLAIAATHVFTHITLLVIFCGLVGLQGFFAWRLLYAPRMNDFDRFYYSAVAFRHGQDMYAPDPQAMPWATKLPQEPLANLNPPHFHLLLLPLAYLSRENALIVWGIVSVCSLGLTLSLIIKETQIVLTPWRFWLGSIALLGFIGTQGTFLTGQLTWLLLLPVTLAWIRARRGQWMQAGAYLGLAMSVKPFLLLFFPFLLLQRKINATIAAGAMIVGCFAVGFVIFGFQAHVGWVQTLASVHWPWFHLNASLLGFLVRIFAGNPEYAPLVIAPSVVQPLWLSVAGIVGSVTLIVTSSDVTEQHIDRSFALLLLAVVLISPLGWAYYLWLPFGPVVALASAGWTQGYGGAAQSCVALGWRRRFVLLAVLGFACPIFATILFQPHGWATISIGSIYFWATFFLWLGLIADWFAAGGKFVGAYERIVG